MIMPNHLHAIVEINRAADSETVEPYGRTVRRETESYDRTDEPDMTTNPIKRNMPVRLPKSISSFIAGFKSAVNTKIDDYIDLYQLDMPKYNRNNHFFQPNHQKRNGISTHKKIYYQ